MDAWSNLATCTLCIGLTWSSYARVENVEDVLYGVIALMCTYVLAYLHYGAKSLHWLPLAAVCTCLAAIATWVSRETSPWYLGLDGSPVILLYVSLALLFCSNVRLFKQASKRSNIHLRDKLHLMRACIFRCLLCIPFASSLYYVNSIFTLLGAPGAVGLADSTMEVNFNRTYCAELDASDDHLYQLYDVTPFTAECVGEVWERLRINLLVIVQFYIAFVLVVDMPYWIKRGLDAGCTGRATEQRKELYAIMYSAQWVSLFAGATASLNQIERWFELSMFPAVMLTISFATCIVRVFLQAPAAQHWNMPFLQPCTEIEKAAALRL